MERREAEERVEALIGWYVHVAIYIAVMCLLTAINITTWHGVPWVLFAGLGWGVGLMAHAIRVGAFRLDSLERWRAAKIDDLMRSAN